MEMDKQKGVVTNDEMTTGKDTTPIVKNEGLDIDHIGHEMMYRRQYKKNYGRSEN